MLAIWIDRRIYVGGFGYDWERGLSGDIDDEKLITLVMRFTLPTG